MSNQPPAVPVTGDDAFNQAQQLFQSEYATWFDAWVIRAQAENERLVEGHRSYAERLAHGPRTIDGAIIFDLAERCLLFIIGDLYARGFFMRRQGLSVEETVKALRQRATEIESETYQGKWKVGLRQLNWGLFKPVDGEAWVGDVWASVVKSTIPDFFDNDLRATLARLGDGQRAREPIIDQIRAAGGTPSVRSSPLISVQVAAKLLGVSVDTIRRMQDSGKLSLVRVGSLRRVPRHEIVALCSSGDYPKVQA